MSDWDDFWDYMGSSDAGDDFLSGFGIGMYDAYTRREALETAVEAGEITTEEANALSLQVAEESVEALESAATQATQDYDAATTQAIETLGTATTQAIANNDAATLQAINNQAEATGVATAANTLATNQAIGTLTGATNRALGLQEEQFGRSQDLLNPYVDAGRGALDVQRALTGASGPGAQQQAIEDIKRSKQFEEMAHQGEVGMLQNASATGGLRGGNIQGALAQYRPAMLSNMIDQRYSQLGGLSGMGQQAATNLVGAGANYANNASNLNMGLAENTSNLNLANTGYGNTMNMDLANYLNSMNMGNTQFANNLNMLGANTANALNLGNTQYAGNNAMQTARDSANIMGGYATDVNAANLLQGTNEINAGLAGADGNILDTILQGLGLAAGLGA
jgi:hypothetical protein